MSDLINIINHIDKRFGEVRADIKERDQRLDTRMSKVENDIGEIKKSFVLVRAIRKAAVIVVAGYISFTAGGDIHTRIKTAKEYIKIYG